MKIVLGNLKDEGSNLLAFLEPRVGTKPTLSGGALEIDDGSIRKGVKPRHVKTYVKRFLHSKGLRKKFRVLVKAKELTVQELEIEAEKEEKAERAEKEERVKETKEEKVAEPEVVAEKPPKREKKEERKEVEKEETPHAGEKKVKPKAKKAAKPKKKKQKAK